MSSSSIEIPRRPSASIRSIPGASTGSPFGAQPSVGEGDFVVLGGSPSVHFLSEADALDDLTVQMSSLGVEGGSGCGAGTSMVQSLSLRADIERLTVENARLTESTTQSSNTLLKHLELCTAQKEQMNRRHETDATMLEEARQATMKLKEENDTLRLCHADTQTKLEDVIVLKFSLEKATNDLRAEVERLEKELAECKDKLEEWDRRADEVSYVHVDGESPGEILAKQADEHKQQVEDLERIIEELKTQIEAAQTAEGNSKIAGLQSEVDELKSLLEKASKFETEVVALRAQVVIVNTQKDTELGQMKQDYNDLIEQVSLDKAAFDEQRERKIQDLTEHVAMLEKEATESRKTLLELDEIKKAKDEAMKKVSELNAETDALKEKLRVATLENGALNATVAHAKEQMMELDQLREREAAFSLLQNDQASQIEAFREALRTEQFLRQKLETDYTNLLQTWQTFEQQQPVIVQRENDDTGVGAAPTNQSETLRGALDLSNAEKLRLEAEVRTLRETINDLQAQNMRFLQDRQVDTVQRTTGSTVLAAAGGAVGGARSRTSPPAEPEHQCPICRRKFSDQLTLIQHAGLCDNEAGI